MKMCAQCGGGFEWSQVEAGFLKRMGVEFGGRRFEVPEPTLCSVCRRQRRYAFRNDRNLYTRTCSKTGKTIISVYSPDKPFPVYSQEAWWSDDHDPLQYGRDFDFSRPFFEQFADLLAVTPRSASTVVRSENCDFTAFTLDSRNCYLSSRIADSEDIYYSYLVIDSDSCYDSFNLTKCELCYECIDLEACYSCQWTERSKGSSNLMFCSDMSSCNDCFGSVGLVQKKYHFFNQALSKEEYEARVKEWFDGSKESVKKCLEAFRAHQQKYPVRALNIFNSENAQGSYIFGSKNVIHSFDVVNSEDVINSTHVEQSKDAMDVDMMYGAELAYEQISFGKGTRSMFCFAVVGGNSDVLYSIDINNGSSDLFGCVGMKQAHHCILNKQYSKEDYEAMVAKILDHMKQTGEWGQFFPVSLSAFGYNETLAMNQLPLSKEEVLAKAWRWHEVLETVPVGAAGENVLQCEVSGRYFRLVAQELEFYKKMNLPVPSLHPDVRHMNRLALRNPYRLLDSTCKKCQKPILTDSDPNKLIYCEACYLAEVY